MANLTYQQLLAEAREILQDVDTDATLQRYPDQTLVNIFNRGFQYLYTIRPDAFYDLWDDTALDFIVPVIIIDATNPPIPNSWLNPFGLPMMFYTPMVNWVIAITESIDDEFTEDSRSAQFYAQFKLMVNGI